MVGMCGLADTSLASAAGIFGLRNADSKEIERLHREFQENSTWQSLRDPILLIMLLLVLSSIIFFTQQEIFQKILAFY